MSHELPLHDGYKEHYETENNLVSMFRSMYSEVTEYAKRIDFEAPPKILMVTNYMYSCAGVVETASESEEKANLLVNLYEKEYLKVYANNKVEERNLGMTALQVLLIDSGPNVLQAAERKEVDIIKKIVKKVYENEPLDDDLVLEFAQQRRQLPEGEEDPKLALGLEQTTPNWLNDAVEFARVLSILKGFEKSNILTAEIAQRELVKCACDRRRLLRHLPHGQVYENSPREAACLKLAEWILSKFHPEELLFMKTSRGDSPLHVAAEDGNLALLKLFIHALYPGYSSSCGMPPWDWYRREHNLPASRGGGEEVPGSSKLGVEVPRLVHSATYADHVHIVRYLLEELHMNPCEATDDGTIPLHVACCRNCNKCLHYFINHAEDNNVDVALNTFSSQWLTPVHCAILFGNKEALHVLIEHRSSPLSKAFSPAQQNKVLLGCLASNLACELEEHFKHPQRKEELSNSPINRGELAKEIIDWIKPENGDRLKSFPVSSVNCTIGELLECYAPPKTIMSITIDRISFAGENLSRESSLLQLAIRTGNLDVVEFLVERGADLFKPLPPSQAENAYEYSKACITANEEPKGKVVPLDARINCFRILLHQRVLQYKRTTKIQNELCDVSSPQDEARKRRNRRKKKKRSKKKKNGRDSLSSSITEKPFDEPIDTTHDCPVDGEDDREITALESESVPQTEPVQHNVTHGASSRLSSADTSDPRGDMMHNKNSKHGEGLATHLGDCESSGEIADQPSDGEDHGTIKGDVEDKMYIKEEGIVTERFGNETDARDAVESSGFPQESSNSAQFGSKGTGQHFEHNAVSDEHHLPPYQPDYSEPTALQQVEQSTGSELRETKNFVQSPLSRPGTLESTPIGFSVPPGFMDNFTSKHSSFQVPHSTFSIFNSPSHSEIPVVSGSIDTVHGLQDRLEEVFPMSQPLALKVEHLLGIGLDQLSTAQLEGLHLYFNQAIETALVRQQELEDDVVLATAMNADMLTLQ